MPNDHRMLRGDAIEIAPVDLALVRYLGVVVEVSLDPVAGWRLAGARAQLADDAVDRDELDFERIADQHLVQQHRAPIRVIVAVDESRDDRHALRVEGLRPLAGEGTDIRVLPTAMNRPPRMANASALGSFGSTVQTFAFTTTTSASRDMFALTASAARDQGATALAAPAAPARRNPRRVCRCCDFIVVFLGTGRKGAYRR